MANRIKGITVEIGGDATKLQTALKGVNSEIRNTQSQLRDVEKLLKLDPGNTELLAQRHRLLGQAVSETKEKLETLKTAAEQANTALANGGDIAGAVRCAAAGDYRDGECSAESGAAGEPVGYGGAEDCGLGGKAADVGRQHFFRGKEVPASYGGILVY